MGVYGGNYGANYDTGVKQGNVGALPRKASIPFTAAQVKKREPEIIEREILVTIPLAVVKGSLARYRGELAVLRQSLIKTHIDLTLIDPEFRLSQLKKGIVSHGYEIKTQKLPTEREEVDEIMHLIEALDALDASDLQ